MMSTIAKRRFSAVVGLGVLLLGGGLLLYFPSRSGEKVSNSPVVTFENAKPTKSVGVEPQAPELKPSPADKDSGIDPQRPKAEPDVTHVPNPGTAPSNPPSNFRSWKDVPTEEKVRRAKEFLSSAVESFQENASYGSVLAAQSFLLRMEDIRKFGGPDPEFDAHTADLYRMKDDLLRRVLDRIKKEKPR
jgi:hypothetical protein